MMTSPSPDHRGAPPPPSLTDLLVARAIAELADDPVTRWLTRLAVVVGVAAVVIVAWMLVSAGTAPWR